MVGIAVGLLDGLEEGILVGTIVGQLVSPGCVGLEVTGARVGRLDG